MIAESRRKVGNNQEIKKGRRCSRLPVPYVEGIEESAWRAE